MEMLQLVVMVLCVILSAKLVVVVFAVQLVTAVVGTNVVLNPIIQ